MKYIISIIFTLFFGVTGFLVIQPNSDAADVFSVRDADNNVRFNINTLTDLMTINVDSLAFTGDIEFIDTFWDDLRFGASALSPQNKNDAVPEYDTTNVGWLFDPDNTESLTIVAQLPHSWKQGSSIQPHIHWEQASDSAVVWAYQYIWTNVGDTVEAWSAVLKDSVGSQTYSAGTLHQITGLDVMDGSDKTLSSIIKIKISRVGGSSGDTELNDVLFTEFDIHYQINSLGSQNEYTQGH